MDFLQQLEIWEKADVMQGKLMVVAGIVACSRYFPPSTFKTLYQIVESAQCSLN